eukprot:2543825-Prymnesium_polylepis.1
MYLSCARSPASIALYRLCDGPSARAAARQLNALATQPWGSSPTDRTHSGAGLLQRGRQRHRSLETTK